MLAAPVKMKSWRPGGLEAVDSGLGCGGHESRHVDTEDRESDSQMVRLSRLTVATALTAVSCATHCDSAANHSGVDADSRRYVCMYTLLLVLRFTLSSPVQLERAAQRPQAN